MSIIQAISPIDGLALGDFEASSPESIQRKMDAARLAAKAWAIVDVSDRAKILSPLSRILMDNLDTINEIIIKTTGKVGTEALLGEIYPVLDLARYYEKNAARILKYQGIPTSPFAFPGATAGIGRRPFGVVAIISPWNYPFQLTVAPILTALFAGNAVIFKTSELSLPIGKMIIALFGKLELPETLVQWVIGDGQCGEQLIDAGPDFVFFTGSLATGRAVMQRAAQQPIPVLLELVGQEPMPGVGDAQLNGARD